MTLSRTSKLASIRIATAIVLCTLLAASTQTTSEKTAHKSPPDWAYVVNPPKDDAAPARPANDNAKHVLNSQASFITTQTQDFYNPPDWHPTGHSAMPKIVSHGRKPDVFACGYCHLPNGQGRPENASLSGLPMGYIVQQMDDFKSGLRKSSEPKHGPTNAMIGVAAKANEKETQAAADYFSELKPLSWIKVVETSTVPKTHVAGWMLVASDSGEKEPIGQRIIETPVNLEQTELRDDHSGFIAYVPVGSIKNGKALVTTGGVGKTIKCSLCHGTDLKGVGNVPSIAGRSPSYIVRQLYDIQNGTRAGAATQQMKPTVVHLTLNDMVAIAAYTASLHP